MISLNNLIRPASWIVRRSITTKWETLNQCRNFTKSSPRSSINLGEMHKPSKFQKKILVWAGTYKSLDQVPDRVSTQQLTRAMDLFRIRVNIGMVIGTVLLCIFAISAGRRLRESGATLSDWGKNQQEEWQRKGEEERAQTAKAASAD